MLDLGVKNAHSGNAQDAEHISAAIRFDAVDGKIAQTKPELIHDRGAEQVHFCRVDIRRVVDPGDHGIVRAGPVGLHTLVPEAPKPHARIVF